MMSITYFYFKENIGRNQWCLIILSSFRYWYKRHEEWAHTDVGESSAFLAKIPYCHMHCSGCAAASWNSEYWVKLALWHCVSIRQPSPISASSSQTAAQRALHWVCNIYMKGLLQESASIPIQEAWYELSSSTVHIFLGFKYDVYKPYTSPLAWHQTEIGYLEAKFKNRPKPHKTKQKYLCVPGSLNAEIKNNLELGFWYLLDNKLLLTYNFNSAEHLLLHWFKQESWGICSTDLMC